MPARDPQVRAISAVIGGIRKHNGPDDPRLPELRRDLRAAKLTEHIKAVVDAAPALTSDQRDRLANLLRAPSLQGEGEAA